MNKILMIAIAGLLVFGAVAQAAEPTPIEDACTTGILVTNNTGRSYDLEGLYIKSRNDTSTLCTCTVAVVNSQDADLTGTNATAANVTYPVKVLLYTSHTNWTADELVRVPALSVLSLTFGGGLTNDFLIFRDDTED